MKNIKTIQFNWETYNSNKDKYEVVTKRGEKVTQCVLLEATDDTYPLVGVINRIIEGWTKDGKYGSSDDSNDLMLKFEEETVHEQWVKVYRVKDSSRLITSKQSFGTRDEALQSCNGLMNVEHIGVINLSELKTN